MYCTNCGKELSEGSVFCTGCGLKIGEEGCLIKVTRLKKVFGFAITFTVYIDDILIGRLGNGDTVERMVPSGTHKVSIKSLEKTLDQEVTLDDAHKEVDITVSIGMGVIAGRVKLESVNYK